MISRLCIVLGSFWVTQSFAFPCYFTLVKDSCWTNYEVTVQVIDTDTQRQILTATIPKGKSWLRQPFSCQPAQKINYTATFKPVIWEHEADKVYSAKRYWMLPDAIRPDQSAWEVSVCFPAAFSTVPYPPDASGNCVCDFASIPAIPPEIRSTPPVQQPGQ